MHSVVGIDPGVTTGLCVLEYGAHQVLQPPILMQVNEAGFLPVLNFLLSSRKGCLVAIEQFVTGNSAGTKGKNADVTRAVIAQAQTFAHMHDCRAVTRKAADVKPWATDKRLERAGILTASNKTSVRHSLDAGRMALWGAVYYSIGPDPLAR